MDCISVMTEGKYQVELFRDPQVYDRLSREAPGCFDDFDRRSQELESE